MYLFLDDDILGIGSADIFQNMEFLEITHLRGHKIESALHYIWYIHACTVFDI